MAATFPLILSIEGNIGTGKSTLLANMQEYYKDNKKICFLPEPVDVWDKIKDASGITILEKYYANQEKYAFSFQMMAYISRLAALRTVLKSGEYDIIIIERSLHTDCNVFAQMLYDDKKIEEIEFLIYKKWFDEFITELPKISFVYIRAEPQVSFERVNKRARNGESLIPLSYLENCHKYHENWLLKGLDLDNSKNSASASLMVLDANLDIKTNPDLTKEWIQKIDQFMARIQEKNEVSYFSSLIEYMNFNKLF